MKLEPFSTARTIRDSPTARIKSVLQISEAARRILGRLREAKRRTEKESLTPKWSGGKLDVLIRTHDPQHDPHREGEPPPRGITHDVRRGKLIFVATSFEFTSARHEDVLRPLRFTTVGQATMNPLDVRNTFTGVR